MNNIQILKLITILGVIVFFIIQMMRKKVSTIIALPAMGIIVAVIASLGVVDGDFFNLFSHPKIDPKTGQQIVGADKKVVMQPGIMIGVIGDGSKMMISAIVSAIFGGALAVMLKKLGVVEEIVKRIAELAGDNKRAIGLSFFIGTTAIFAAIGGLGPIILVGTIALPIMVSAGIKPRDAASIILLAVSCGGTLNPANWATFTAILVGTGMDAKEAYNMIVNMSYMIFGVAFTISLIYVLIIVQKKSYARAWAVNNGKASKQKISLPLLIAPILPIIIIFVTTLINRNNPSFEIFTPELAILLAIGWITIFAKTKNKGQLVSGSFVEGTQEVAGAIVLLIGLGILIKGFQFYTVTPIIAPLITSIASALKNPITYVLGFTLATPLVLYRGPLNTFGIGGSIPALFAAAGLSPLATIYALRATGNLQGFGDPTNSQNIWIADFVKIDPNEITKALIWIGFLMTFVTLLAAVILNPTMLKV